MTADGFPLAYEVLPGNTSDKTTLEDFLEKIERQYGKANRVWVMDRGIPTESSLTKMRESDSPVHYLVGTPKGRLSKLEKKFPKSSIICISCHIQYKIEFFKCQNKCLTNYLKSQ